MPAAQSAAAAQAVSHLLPVHEPLVHSVAAPHVAPPAFFGVHALGCAAVSQKLPLAQSASAAQTVPHEPAATLQIGPPWLAPAQSAFVAHLPHEPSAFWNGFAAVGQGCVAAVPLSPFATTHEPSFLQTGEAVVGHARTAFATPLPAVQAAQAPVVRSQVAFVPVQSARFVAEHSVH